MNSRLQAKKALEEALFLGWKLEKRKGRNKGPAGRTLQRGKKGDVHIDWKGTRPKHCNDSLPNGLTVGKRSIRGIPEEAAGRGDEG